MMSEQAKVEGDEVVLLQREGGGRIVTLNRPEKRNAANFALQKRLMEVMEEIAADKEARVVVLTGAGSDTIHVSAQALLSAIRDAVVLIGVFISLAGALSLANARHGAVGQRRRVAVPGGVQLRDLVGQPGSDLGQRRDVVSADGEHHLVGVQLSM